MRVLSIRIYVDGGVSEYKIKSPKGCCIKNLIPKSLSNRLYLYLVKHLESGTMNTPNTNVQLRDCNEHKNN